MTKPLLNLFLTVVLLTCFTEMRAQGSMQKGPDGVIMEHDSSLPPFPFNVNKDGKQANVRSNPNPPSTSSTTISFKLEHDAFVVLRLFDPLGNLLKELVNGQLVAGMHSVPVNAQNLETGIYFYSLRVNELTETKKLTIKK